MHDVLACHVPHIYHDNWNYNFFYQLSPKYSLTHSFSVFLFIRYQRVRYYRGWGFGIGMCVLATVIIGLSVSLSVRYNDNGDNDNLFAPGDTRILSYSSSFCEGLTLTGDKNATLYLLDGTPPLSGPTNKLVVQAPSVIHSDTYEYLLYYLHFDSTVTMTYCIESGNSLSFFLIKGSGNFNSWVDDGNSIHSIKHITINNICSSSSPASYSYTVSAGDSYYFAFDNVLFSDVSLRATLNFDRTEYLPEEAGVHNSCGVLGSSCTLHVPYDSDYVAMIKIGASDAEPDENIAFNWSCNARVWLYVIIVVVPILFTVVANLMLCAMCIYCARKHSKTYSTLPTATGTDESPATVTTATTATNTASAPPPSTNPDYPPSYGSTHFTEPEVNPPPYTEGGSKN